MSSIHPYAIAKNVKPRVNAGVLLAHVSKFLNMIQHFYIILLQMFVDVGSLMLFFLLSLTSLFY